MDRAIEALVRMTRREFEGPSLLGPAFLPYLRSLPLEAVRSRESYEGYSVWGISLHALYRKWVMLPLLGGGTRPELFPYEERDWPEAPAAGGQEAWTELLRRLEAVHGAYLEALAALRPDRMGEPVEAWGCTLGEAAEAMCHHDLYHLVQIRNMGLKNLPPG